MKLILLLFLLFAGTVTSAQGNTETITKRIDSVHSAILKEQRYIWIHVPKSASANLSKRYPVIYLLDGEIHFNEVISILNRLSKETGKNIANEMIVVGIGNIWQRYRDYSPSAISSSPWVDEHTAKTTGGNEKFIAFLEKELFPHIKATYPVSPSRILIGHSMGGLAVMNILLKHTGMFDYYAAIDPSMWWDELKLLQESKEILVKKSFEEKSLFLAIANTMGKKMDMATIRKDTSPTTALIRPSFTLADFITANKQNKLRFEWKFYKDFDHMSVPPTALYDALKYFLTVCKKNLIGSNSQIKS